MRQPVRVSRGPVALNLICVLAACSGENPLQPEPASIVVVAGDNQVIAAGQPGTPLSVLVADNGGSPIARATVTWQHPPGFGMPASSITGPDGIATAAVTAGSTAGRFQVSAIVTGTSSTRADFTITVSPGPAAALTIAGGNGQQVPVGAPAPQPLRVRARDQFGNPVPGVQVAWAVSAGTASVDPATSTTDSTGVASASVTGAGAGANTITATTGSLSVAFRATGVVGAVLVAEVPIPANYGIHDTFVRDGLAFVSAWNTGLIIYDVGSGIRGGTPWAPVEVSRIITAGGGVSGGAQVHNAWWYHAPDGQKRYVFIGQEGPGAVGSASSGDIHVVDVSNIAQPVEVATYRMAGAGTHNFWVDEANQILYAAYYNGGVVALDISGTLSGDLSSREIARVQPGGPGNTYVWGVMLSGGSLYASDMVSGFWQLRLNGTAFQVLAGGFNVADRYTSDLWVHGSYAYTGTWGNRGGRVGNAVKIWQLDATGAPLLVDSLLTGGISTVSDIEVSSDGRMLLFSAENGSNAGLHLFSLVADPRRPASITSVPVSAGVHTATFATIGGRRYLFAAKDPPSPALQIYDVQTIAP